MIDFSEALDLLSKRSFGGNDVATDPATAAATDTFFGSGPLPFGVEESLEWFLGGAYDTKQTIKMLFLVGGPGNGKSFVASKLGSSLKLTDTFNGAIAHREYHYESEAGIPFVLINDASIVNPDRSPKEVGISPLARDIVAAIDNSSNLMVNVNRGVLYRELPENEIWTIGRSLLEWVGGADFSLSVQGRPVEVQTFSEIGALQFSRIEMQNKAIKIEALAIHLDGLSLLESKPQVKIPYDSNEKPEQLKKYAIQKFADRSIEFSQATPAGNLMESFFRNFPNPDKPLHPFSANVQNLKDAGVQRGLLAILRAAEIATNHRFSYRDLWGLMATAVLGQKEVMGSISASKWEPLAVNPDDQIAKQIDALQRNSAMRFHQALVGALPKSLSQTSIRQITSSNAVEAVRRVDPSVDARVGGVIESHKMTFSQESSWASTFFEALSATSESGSFLETALSALPAEVDFRECVTDFEWTLDAHVKRIMDPNSRAKDVERRELLAWYGEYLIRLFAFTQGFPAFFEELSEWIGAWRSSSATQTLTRQVSQGLKSLLLPHYEGLSGQDGVLLPAFSSKTEPLIERTIEKVVAIEVPGAALFSSDVAADELFVTLKIDGKNIVELSLDFSLMREILNCASTSSGASEESVTSVPRIERIRSSMLVSGKTASRIYVVDGTQLQELTPTSEYEMVQNEE